MDPDGIHVRIWDFTPKPEALAELRARTELVPGRSSRILGFQAKPVYENKGGLKGSMQHWLEVYSQEFQNPRSLAAVDSDAGLFCPGPIA